LPENDEDIGGSPGVWGRSEFHVGHDVIVAVTWGEYRGQSGYDLIRSDLAVSISHRLCPRAGICG
jgi:hypothetical protein